MKFSKITQLRDYRLVNSIFFSSYIILCILIAANALLASSILRHVLKYQKTLDNRPTSAWSGLPRGLEAPEFRVSHLKGNATLSKSTIQNRGSAVLIFVSSTTPPKTISWAANKVQGQSEGKIYFICEGPQFECLVTLDQSKVEDIRDAEFLHDENGEVAKQFGIESKPSVVILDELGCITKAGLGTGRLRDTAQAPASTVQGA